MCSLVKHLKTPLSCETRWVSSCSTSLFLLHTLCSLLRFSHFLHPQPALSLFLYILSSYLFLPQPCSFLSSRTLTPHPPKKIKNLQSPTSKTHLSPPRPDLPLKKESSAENISSPAPASKRTFSSLPECPLSHPLLLWKISNKITTQITACSFFHHPAPPLQYSQVSPFDWCMQTTICFLTSHQGDDTWLARIAPLTKSMTCRKRKKKKKKKTSPYGVYNYIYIIFIKISNWIFWKTCILKKIWLLTEYPIIIVGLKKNG